MLFNVQLCVINTNSALSFHDSAILSFHFSNSISPLILISLLQYFHSPSSILLHPYPLSVPFYSRFHPLRVALNSKHIVTRNLHFLACPRTRYRNGAKIDTLPTLRPATAFDIIIESNYMYIHTYMYIIYCFASKSCYFCPVCTHAINPCISFSPFS